jgi:hypothetical protein
MVLRGRSSTNSTRFGMLEFRQPSFERASTASSSSAAPWRLHDHGGDASPKSGCGTPITALRSRRQRVDLAPRLPSDRR